MYKTFDKLRIDLGEKIPGSKHFRWYEALYLPSAQAYAVPDEDQIKGIKMQANALDKVRIHFDSRILVHSWLRTNWYNKQIGGSRSSSHMIGFATDFTVVGFTHKEIKDELRLDKKIYGGRGEIDTTNWVHLDLKRGNWFYARRATR